MRVRGKAKWVTALLGAGAALGMPAAAEAVFPGEDGQIGFVSGRGAGGDASADIYLLDGINGTVSSPLFPVLTGQHRHPSFSPNGEKVAFALWTSTTDRDIWIGNVGQTGSGTFRDTDDITDDRPAWSPDGKYVAYESEVTAASTTFDILISEVATGNTVNLTPSTPASNETKPVWSPNGKDIYYSTNKFGDYDIYREASNNTQATPTLILGAAADESQPALSPDGSELCFLRGPYGAAETDIITVPSSGSGTQVDISENVGSAAANADYNCAWSPEGDRVLFVKGTFSNGELMVANADASGTPTSATPNAAAVFDGNPDWRRVPEECDDKPAGVIGTENSETLNGFATNDTVQALAGDDIVKGKAGKDRECGKGGEDKLKGGAANDTLLGGGQNDSLDGGPGNDKCFGGPGVDSFKDCESIAQ